ncbi:MAG: pyrroline-5-carboxylate reductase [Bacillota bacterium]|nr:pyrroline-5-carboxylate reductase [Bacillota bacterium]
MTGTMGVIGCGKMAYALVGGLGSGDTKFYEQLYVCDPSDERIALFQEKFHAISADRDQLINEADIILLAVKPQQIKTVITNLPECSNKRKLFVSIAAGISTSELENNLGKKSPVIRVMPNTPCLVGAGMSVVAGGRYASQEELLLVQRMFGSVGQAIIMEEHYMDAVTAVSGSGPAYVFLLVEAMIEAGVNVGLPADLARQLVLQTFQGGVAMLTDSNEHPAVLKAQVCSPQGTTIAGVRKMEEYGIRTAFFEAIDAAYQRSMELGQLKSSEGSNI